MGFSFNVQVHLCLVVTFKRSSLFHIVNFGTADRLLGVQCFLGGEYLFNMDVPSTSFQRQRSQRTVCLASVDQNTLNPMQ